MFFEMEGNDFAGLNGSSFTGADTQLDSAPGELYIYDSLLLSNVFIAELEDMNKGLTDGSPAAFNSSRQLLITTQKVQKGGSIVEAGVLGPGFGDDHHDFFPAKMFEQRVSGDVLEYSNDIFDLQVSYGHDYFFFVLKVSVDRTDGDIASHCNVSGSYLINADFGE
jgi:hypothetical protein